MTNFPAISTESLETITGGFSPMAAHGVALAKQAAALRAMPPLELIPPELLPSEALRDVNSGLGTSLTTPTTLPRMR